MHKPKYSSTIGMNYVQIPSHAGFHVLYTLQELLTLMEPKQKASLGAQVEPT